jgi:hypothetical protein
MSKLLLAFVLSALCGCASSKDELPPAARNAGSHPPTFLTGAVSVLLTNAAAGFSAWVEMDPNAARAVRDFTSGQLLCSGSRLLFVPSYGSKKARVRSGGVTFIWDVAEARGIVMSESLQAFAPYTASVNPTNVVTAPNKGPQQKIDGHLCDSLEQVVQMSDGSARSFQVLRAADLKQVPLQISTVTNAAPSTVTLSKIRLEPLSPELFVPPEGFTKYTSAEGMMDELAVRQGGLKRKSSEDLTLPEPSDSSYKRGR